MVDVEVTGMAILLCVRGKMEWLQGFSDSPRNSTDWQLHYDADLKMNPTSNRGEENGFVASLDLTKLCLSR